MVHVSGEALAAVEPFGRIARLLAAADDSQEVLDEIVRLAVEQLDACEFAGISLVEGRKFTSPASTSEGAGLIDAIQAETDQGPCLDAIKEHEVFQTGDLMTEDRWPKFSTRAHASTGVRSILSLRLFMEEDTFGSLNLYSTKADAFDASDVARGEVFASHAAVALRAARSSTEVLALQRSMLPHVLPEVTGISMAARYLPASIGANVGGDWYDALRLDGHLAVTLGDVAGHGLAAASVMGQIRNALRAYTVADSAPATAVGLVSKLLDVVEPDAMATLCHLIIDVDDKSDDGVTLHWVSAGHLLPLVVGDDGHAHFLTGEVGPPIGMSLPASFTENTSTLAAGQTVLLYSDGLVERRDEAIDVSLQHLADAAERAPKDLEAFCDYIIDNLVASAHDDDVAVLALRVDRT